MSYATNILTSLPFGNIIGGPMKAAIEAQAIAARATVDFIREVGFTPAVNGTNLVDNDLLAVETVGGKTRAVPVANFGEIRTVTFTYKTASETVAPPPASGSSSGATPPPTANPDREVSLTVPLC